MPTATSARLVLRVVFSSLVLFSGVVAAEARTLTGVVTDSSGAAVQGADVFVGCGPVWRRTQSNARGEFSVAGLPEERCGVRVERDEFSPERLTVDLASGDRNVSLTLGLRGLATEVAVTPGVMSEERMSQVPLVTTVTDAAEIRARVHQILPQALEGEPGISVQQTTSAQGAPVIRGLIGQQNVLMIDGVRLNTAAWRSGPSQYMAWYGASLVDRIEVVRGPTSALYGSDALGGTVQVRSIQPMLSGGGVRTNGSVGLGGSTADSGAGADALIRISGPKVGFLAAGGYQHFEDIRAGGGEDSHAAVTRFLGVTPSQVFDRERQINTGYEQRFGQAAVTVALGQDSRLAASYFMSEQTGASRYDRIDGGEGLFRSEFTPQVLSLSQVRYERGRTAIFDQLHATFSVNRQEDGRLEQSRPTANVDAQVNTTTAYGYQFQGGRQLQRHALTMGAELYDEYIAGSRTVTTPAGVVSRARPDIPDGTRYTSSAAFVQDVYELRPGRVWLRGGLRYSHYGFGTPADAALGVLDEAIDGQAMTGQGALVVALTPSFSVTASAARGYRAPNAFDFGSVGVTSVFEVAPDRAAALGGVAGTTDGATAVSSGNTIATLKPEAAISYEAGIRFNNSRVSALATVFDTELRDTILRRTVIFPGNVVGQSIGAFEIVRQDAAGRAFIATQSAPLVTRVNVTKARIWGFEGQASVRVAERWTTGGYWSYANGTDLDAATPLRRVPAGNGGVSVRWDVPDTTLWIEGVGTFSLEYTRMAPGDITDARMGARRDLTSIASYFNGRAVDQGLVRGGVLTVTGETLAQVQARVLGGATAAPMFASLPAYAVFGARAGFRVGQHLDLLVVGENLTDRNYRRIGSGVDAPGAQVSVRSRVTF